jgi:MYXO-CTERM domain-containing protein
MTPSDLPPLATADRDRGRMPPDTVLTGLSLLFDRTPEAEVRSRLVLEDLQDPGSPDYHRWMSPTEVTAAFGTRTSDVAQATAWLEAAGFTVHGPSPTRTRLFFSGTVAQVERAFRTEMHRYEIHGGMHRAPSVQPTYPAELPHVLGLMGLHDFHARPERPAPGHPDGVLSGSGGPTLALAPADFAAVYDVAPLYAAGLTGAGQRIAIVGVSQYPDADVQAFRQQFGLDAANLPARELVPLSGNPFSYTGLAYTETVLDLEWAGAVAKDATLGYFYVGDNPGYTYVDAILAAIDDGTYRIISSSYAGCEYDETPSDLLFMEVMGDTAAMEGTTLLVASGDTGAAECDYAVGESSPIYGPALAWPSSQPDVVSVGGTELDWGDTLPEPPLTTGSIAATPFATYWTCTDTSSIACTAQGYVPETSWNELAQFAATGQFFGASGGGQSTLFAKPIWQVGQTPSGSFRMAPDVSLSAALLQVPYVIYQTDPGASAPTAHPIGGTSAATPSLAGILALVSQAIAAKSPGATPGLGNANPVLYAIAASTAGVSGGPFHDITTGSNIVTCAPGSYGCPAAPPYQYGFDAGPGYDMVTGLGSVDANALAAAWKQLVPTATTLAVSAAGSAGTSYTVQATVTPASAGPVMTGAVVFYAVTGDDAGVPDLSAAVTAPIAAGDAGTASASATITPAPGTVGASHIVATYTGDARYLASYSHATAVTAATDGLAISPATSVFIPGKSIDFTALGGVAPYGWFIVRDGTCTDTSTSCAYVSATPGTPGATLMTDDHAGTLTLAVVDSAGNEARAVLQSLGLSDGGMPDATDDAPAGDASPSDAGSGATDARAPTAEGGGDDAGTTGGGSKGGCSCAAAGTGEGSGAGFVLMIAGLAAVVARRRTSRCSPGCAASTRAGSTWARTT